MGAEKAWLDIPGWYIEGAVEHTGLVQEGETATQNGKDPGWVYKGGAWGQAKDADGESVWGNWPMASGTKLSANSSVYAYPTYRRSEAFALPADAKYLYVKDYRPSAYPQTTGTGAGQNNTDKPVMLPQGVPGASYAVTVLYAYYYKDAACTQRAGSTNANSDDGTMFYQATYVYDRRIPMLRVPSDANYVLFLFPNADYLEEWGLHVS